MKEVSLRIDGEIGGWINTADEFTRSLNELGLEKDDTLKLIINSQGGSVLDGFAIYNQLKALPNKIIAKVEGLSASIATLIMLAADEIQMSEVGLVMIHNASVFVEGNKEELEKQKEVLATIDNTLKNVYAAKTGVDLETIENWMAETKWFDATEALEIGLVDKIVDKIDAKMAAQMQSLNKNKIMKLSNFFKSMIGDTAKKKAELTEEEEAELARLLEKQKEGEEETEEETAARLAAETEEEKEKREEEEAAAILKAAADDDEEEKKKEEEAKDFVTAEQFAKMVDAVTALADRVEQNMEAQANATSAQVVETFEQLVKGLPASKGTPPAAAGDLNAGSGKGWKDPHAAFRAKMKEIETKTRN